MKRIFGLTAALLLSAVAGLWAQNTPAGILESPQSTSSQGRYRSTADNFIRTDAYGDVKFDKFFAYTSFYPGSTSRASLGFATKVGSAYLGLYYGGNFWSGIQPWNSTEVDQDFKDAKKTFPTYTTAPEYSNANTTTDNRFAVLIGAANMGFRLSYASTYQSFKGEDIYDSTNDTFFKSHET
ncbi:MAG: hypothetical protein LBG91_04850, partial [Treponema sp.]|nr:hypothetical protein [Treponema sp.]